MTLSINRIQKTSDYRQGTGDRKSAPIIGRAVNQMFETYNNVFKLVSCKPKASRELVLRPPRPKKLNIFKTYL